MRTILSFLLLVAVQLSAAEYDAKALVAKIDSYRGLGNEGFSFEISNVSYRKGHEPRSNKLSVSVLGGNSLVKFESPARQRGRVLLKKDDDLWLYIPGTRKVIRISSAQRLLGETSNGDVVGSNYADDYDARLTTDDGDRKNHQIRLELTARKNNLSYHKVVFWLNDDEQNLPLRSEYYARSGKLLKIAHYKEFKTFEGKKMVHKMLLVDPLIEGSSTWMMFDNYHPAQLPLAMFSKEAIVNL